jgi:hypothetical protein
MITAEYLDMLDQIARRLTGNDIPFGGIQVRPQSGLRHLLMSIRSLV